MISLEQVRKSFAGFSPQRLKKLLPSVLKGEAVLPLSGGRSDEPPEDILAQLLLDFRSPKDLRQVVLDGCKRLFVEVLPSTLTQDSLRKPLDAPQSVFVRLCRIVDLAKPEELRSMSISLLRFLLDQETHPDVLGACVRAAMAYPAAGQSFGLWDELLARKDLAAYGFMALLALNPKEVRMVDELARLWLHRVEDGWPTDAAFLTLHASHKDRFGDALIGKVLTRLRRSHRRSWPLVIMDLQRRVTTRDWLDRKDVAPGPIESYVEQIIQSMGSSVESSVNGGRISRSSRFHRPTPSIRRAKMLRSDALARDLCRSKGAVYNIYMNHDATKSHIVPPVNGRQRGKIRLQATKGRFYDRLASSSVSNLIAFNEATNTKSVKWLGAESSTSIHRSDQFDLRFEDSRMILSWRDTLAYSNLFELEEMT